MSIAGYEIYKDGKKQSTLQGTTKRRELNKLRMQGYRLKKIFNPK